MSCFDEQPDGDIHGECAEEIHRLEQETEKMQAQVAMLRYCAREYMSAQDEHFDGDTCCTKEDVEMSDASDRRLGAATEKLSIALSETASSDAWMKEHDAKVLEENIQSMNLSFFRALRNMGCGNDWAEEAIDRASHLCIPESDVDQDTRMA